MDVYGKDLYDCIKLIYKDFKEKNQDKEYMMYDFMSLTDVYNKYIGDEYECKEVKEVCILLAEMGFIKLFVNVDDEAYFFLAVDL